jgi:hypothetical protein
MLSEVRDYELAADEHKFVSSDRECYSGCHRQTSDKGQ